jgi:Tfp pilus assembly protein PilN
LKNETIFTIDLLKGQAIPRKSTPGSIGVTAAATTVPVIIAIALLGMYVRNRVVISVHGHTIANYEAKISELSEAVELQKSFEKEKGTYSDCLAEISNRLEVHTQWSPVLMTLVENMPDSVVLTGLDVKQRSVKKQVRQKDDPAKMTTVSVPLRTLTMTVAAKPQSNSDEAIRNFSEQLRSSSSLGPKLENIRISQGLGLLEGKSVVSYQIECIFKAGL